MRPHTRGSSILLTMTPPSKNSFSYFGGTPVQVHDSRLWKADKGIGHRPGNRYVSCILVITDEGRPTGASSISMCKT